MFYELGLAHAVSKPVVLLSNSIDDVPFDLRSIRVLLYDKDNPHWGDKLRTSLVRAITEVLRSPTSSIPSTFKDAVAVTRPEEPELLMRIEGLESMVRRMADDLDYGSWEVPPQTAKSSAQEAAVQTPQLHVGQRVVHKKFGRGTVVDVEGSGEDERVQINFDRAGAKWLATSVANIDPLSDK